MGRRILSPALALIGAFAILLGILGVDDESTATPLPSACVYVALDVQGLVTTTIKKETASTTCPSLPPPSTGDPCPGGNEIRHDDDNFGIEHDVMVCLKNLP